MPNTDQPRMVVEVVESSTENDSSTENESSPEFAELTRRTRQPTNLQGLLRFATEATRFEDALGMFPVVPMDEERRRFLDEAINSMTIDTTQEMKTAIRILSDKDLIVSINCDSEVPPEVQMAFDNLMDTVYDIDMSIGLYKLDGYSIFPVCFSCEHPQVRSLACKLLAETCQHNPFCQERALDCGFLHIVLNILTTEDDTKVLRSALYAASCLIRENEQCAVVFLSEGGGAALARCVKSSDHKLQDRAAFVISAIYPKYPALRGEMTCIIKDLVFAIQNVENRPDELLNALHAIVTNADEKVLSECCKPELGLRETIEKQLALSRANSQGDGSFFEDISNCESILKLIHSNNHPGSSREVKTSAETNVDR